MTDPDRTARIFHQVLEVAPEWRAAFLDRVCAGDVEFRAEMESLLRHHQLGTLSDMFHSGGVIEPSRSAGWPREFARLSEGFRDRRWQTVAWVLAALFLGGIGYWTRARVERSLRNQIQEQLRVVLIADTTALETWIGTRKVEATTWAGNPAVRDLAERFVRLGGEDPAKAAKLKDSPLQKEFTAVFRSFLAQAARPEDSAAVLLDRTGLRLAASVTLARIGARETRLGAYTLLHLIGEGGMSKVYLARHALLRRPSAIKVLKAPPGPSHEAIVRFEREAGRQRSDPPQYDPDLRLRPDARGNLLLRHGVPTRCDSG